MSKEQQVVSIDVSSIDYIGSELRGGQNHQIWHVEYDIRGNLQITLCIEVASSAGDLSGNEAKRIALVELRDFLVAAARTSQTISPWS